MFKRYSEGIRLFGKESIKEKGGDFQQELLEKAKLNGPDFVEWLDGKIAYCLHDSGEVVEGDIDIDLPSVERITAGQFINPCMNDMVEWYNLWSDIPMSDASSFGFWGYVTRRMIEEGKILPSYLVLSKDSKKELSGEDGGMNKINDVINGSPKEMDDCVRNFCRNLSGLFDARGTRSLYVDCCLARAWWKCHVSESAGRENWKETTLPIIREGVVWVSLGEKMSSKLTVLGDVNIRDGIIQFLSSDEGMDSRRGNEITSLLLRVGVRTSWCAMGVFTPEEVHQQVAEIAKKT